MSTLLTILFVSALVGTLVVLGLGVAQMARGGGDGRRSNRLMQYRVLFQGLAVLLFLALLLLARG
ncbi:MAG: twin transmembrane helix small protein [Rhodovarius sp.]|nr:twin transmembrane helix small protein [Rhodovarius sp.]MCX7931637.1 twin transmembrane helix small protein [Rhodovarius sp.]MDW8314358.1 twin transmembrane helix small protein [Rhodovarius sp.]